MKRHRPDWKPLESAQVNARRVLPQLLGDYFTAGRKLDRASRAKDMHAFRLKTKHLRYTLEAFVSLYGPGLKPRVDRLRPIQNALGELNDCEVLLSELKRRLSAPVRAYVRQRSNEKHREFLRYWREDFDLPDEEKKWLQYLTRGARGKTGG